MSYMYLDKLTRKHLSNVDPGGDMAFKCSNWKKNPLEARS